MRHAVPTRPQSRPAAFGGRPSFLHLLLLILLLLPGLPAWAQQPITGVVLDAGNSAPIAGARVQVQARPETAVFTDGNGRFTLSVAGLPGNSFAVGAALAYDAARAVNHETAVRNNVAPGADISISLPRAPSQQNPDYQPADSGSCRNCHSAQYDQWLTSNHNRAARNVRVRDLYSGDGTVGNPLSGEGYVFINTHDPDNSGLCATCHAPNERPLDPGAVKFNEVVTPAGMEGVTCTSCHQLHVINDQVDEIHLLGNAEFFLPPGNRADRHVWGPLADVGSNQMNAFYAPVFSDSRMCASCHEYVTPGSGAPGQETYSEWLASPAALDGISCQDCHMPPAAAPGQIANQGPSRPASQRRDHSFPGVYSGRLGDPVELVLLIEEVTADSVHVRSELTSLVLGHNWPTGVDPRNALLVLEVTLDGEPLTQIGGDVLPFWASADPEVAPGNGDYAGQPGRGYAKVLEGRINGEGPIVRPVPFIDAERLYAKTTLPPGETDIGSYTFALPPDAQAGAMLEVHGRVLYRRAWRDWAVTKGWTEIPMDEPWERLVEEKTISQTLEGGATFTVSATAGEGGSIEPLSRQVVQGSTTTFTVTPDTGHSIDEVTGCNGSLSGEAYTTGAITQDCTVTASFTLNTHSVVVSADPPDGGNASGAGQFDFGASVTVTADANTGYRFVNWTEAGSQVSGDAEYTFTMPDRDRALVAHFTAASFVLTLSANPDAGGSVTGAGGYDFNDQVTVTAQANEGYSFVNWTENDQTVSESASYIFNMPARDRSLVANFSLNRYTVTATAGEGGSIAPSSVEVEHGSTTTFTVTPDPGYAIDEVAGCGGSLAGNEYTTGVITSACDVIAEFEPDEDDGEQMIFRDRFEPPGG